MGDNWYWYHFIATTYGAWLYGDSRGFRTRHHREHVEGDYKNPPPPGKYAEQERRSRESMPEDPVVLPVELRPVVGMAILERLRGLGAQVLVLSVSGQHIHGLARMPFGQPRRWLGLAKRHVWFVLRDHGWRGKLWGKRSKAIPIKDRPHQVNTFNYILRHVRQGAWIWSFRQEKQEPPSEPPPSPQPASCGEGDPPQSPT
jgi:hypothetical protein